MNRTGAFWTHVASQAKHLSGLLKAAGLSAPFTSKMLKRLRRVERVAQFKAIRQIKRGNISAKEGVVVLEPEVEKRPRKHRTTPANSFKGREANVTWEGDTQVHPTIASAVCWIFSTHGKWIKGKGFVSKKELDITKVAKAIKAAWPESTYGPHRVDYDLKKFMARKFSCQRRTSKKVDG